MSVWSGTLIRREACRAYPAIMPENESLLSPMEQAAAQQAASEAIKRYRAEVKDMLASRNNGLKLVGEDLGGIFVGAGADLVGRLIFTKYLKMKDGEAPADYHKRWDRWSGATSAALGGASLLANLAMTHRKVQIGHLAQAGRVAGIVSLTLGVNRLVS